MVNVRLWMGALALAGGLAMLPHAPVFAQNAGKTAAPWTPPKTAWGHPDIEGLYTNRDETNTPLERPDEFKGRAAQDFTAADLAALAKQRQALAAKIAGGIGGAETGAGPTHWYEHLQGNGSRPWLIIDPPDGKLPPMTKQALSREASVAKLNDARNGEGRADSWLDRSMYDRCITRGIPGSMMPAIYGNAYEIVQTRDAVAIRYEMIHETRIIPLDGRPRIGTAIKEYVGDARGHWDGNTLVVETTNFTNRTHFGYNNRYNSEKFVLTERFTPTGPNTLQWQVTFNDPEVWTRPFTFTMPLTRDRSQPIFEYACHEGNLGLEHILSAARAEGASSSESSEALEDAGGAHAAADAHRDEAVAGAAAAHLVNERRRELGAGAAEGVAEGDCTAVDVEAIGVDRQLLETREHLGGERFVELDEVDLVE